MSDRNSSRRAGAADRTADDRRPARQQLADELAARLADPEALRVLRLAQIQGVLGEDRPPASGGRAAAPPPAASAPRPISIWRPRGAGDDLVFERPEPHPLGDHHAIRRRLTPRAARGTARVCFFGESVAAGYLWAPHLTPAGVLESHLARADASRGWEVVDLARTNETLGSLSATVEASLQLAPDALVIFAGNNWTLLETPELSPYAPTVEARQRTALALRDGGLEGAVRRATRERRRAIRRTAARIAALAAGAGVPVVWLIPEVGLADWQNRQPVPWLPGNGVARWHRELERGRRALAAGETDLALAAARAMRRLDDGLVPTAFRLEARAHAAAGAESAAAAACRGEVTAQHYPLLCHLGAPQAKPGDQELLRELGRLHGFSAVDLPAIFAEHTGSALTGRRLFLDYCHLSAEGMHVAMAAAAAAVLSRSRGRAGDAAEAPGWRRLAAELPPPEPPPSVVATACLGAAVHAAHRLLAVDGKRRVLDLWIGRALDASPAVADACFDLVEARCAPLPAVLTAAQQRNLGSRHRLQLQHGWRWPGLDPLLLERLSKALVARLGPAAGERVEQLLRAARPAGAVDLLAERWLWEPVERFLADAMRLDDLDGRAVYRAPWPRSSFAWLHPEPGDGRLTIGARLPARDGRERRAAIDIEVGGRRVTRLDARSSWRRWEIRVPAAMMRPGLNRLSVRWPLPDAAASPSQPGADPLDVLRRELEDGVESAIHPVFGELFLLRAES